MLYESDSLGLCPPLLSIKNFGTTRKAESYALRIGCCIDLRNSAIFVGSNLHFAKDKSGLRFAGCSGGKRNKFFHIQINAGT